MGLSFFGSLERVEEGLGLLLPVLKLFALGLLGHLDSAALVHELLQLLPITWRLHRFHEVFDPRRDLGLAEGHHCSDGC